MFAHWRGPPPLYAPQLRPRQPGEVLARAPLYLLKTLKDLSSSEPRNASIGGGPSWPTCGHPVRISE